MASEQLKNKEIYKSYQTLFKHFIVDFKKNFQDQDISFHEEKIDLNKRVLDYFDDISFKILLKNTILYDKYLGPCLQTFIEQEIEARDEKIFKMEKILKYLVSLLRNSKRIKKSAFENINTTMHQFYSVYDKFQDFYNELGDLDEEDIDQNDLKSLYEDIHETSYIADEFLDYLLDLIKKLQIKYSKAKYDELKDKKFKEEKRKVKKIADLYFGKDLLSKQFVSSEKVKYLFQNLKPEVYLDPDQSMYYISNDREDRIEDLLIQKIKEQRITSSDMRMRENAIKNLQGLLEGLTFEKIKVNDIKFATYGSYCNGLGTKSSDIDSTFLTDCYFDERLLLNMVYTLLYKKIEAQHAGSYTIKSVASDTVRVPLLEFKDNTQITPISIDICCNNILGFVNSKMISTYTSIHDKVKQLGILIKYWAKLKDIQSKNAFSSYSLVIMMIHFLQKQNYLPYLQSLYLSVTKECAEKNYTIFVKRQESMGKMEEFETNIYFESNLDKIKQYMAQQRFKSLSDVSLSDLLEQFLEFYYDYFQKQEEEQKKKISIKSNREILRGKEDDSYLISIEDPFDIPHNPGDRVNQQVKARNIRDKFKYAYRDHLEKLTFKLFEKGVQKRGK